MSGGGGKEVLCLLRNLIRSAKDETSGYGYGYGVRDAHSQSCIRLCSSPLSRLRHARSLRDHTTESADFFLKALRTSFPIAGFPFSLSYTKSLPNFFSI